MYSQNRSYQMNNFVRGESGNKGSIEGVGSSNNVKSNSSRSKNNTDDNRNPNRARKPANIPAKNNNRQQTQRQSNAKNGPVHENAHNQGQKDRHEPKPRSENEYRREISQEYKDEHGNEYGHVHRDENEREHAHENKDERIHDHEGEAGQENNKKKSLFKIFDFDIGIEEILLVGFIFILLKDKNSEGSKDNWLIILILGYLLLDKFDSIPLLNKLFK